MRMVDLFVVTTRKDVCNGTVRHTWEGSSGSAAQGSCGTWTLPHHHHHMIPRDSWCGSLLHGPRLGAPRFFPFADTDRALFLHILFSHKINHHSWLVKHT